MNQNPLKVLESLGQSIWTDFISRTLITSGELQNYVEKDGVSGVTSNPSIFEKAIAESHDYDESIEGLARKGKNIEDIYQILTVDDIQHTADILRPTFNRLGGSDGFVSLEVSPKLANDTSSTIEEARRLWSLVDRPNVMIKVPGTEAGVPAIRQLISEGININVTLLFGLDRYRRIAEAFVEGLERRGGKNDAHNNVASVASFFLSRIDVLLDPLLEEKARRGGPDAKAAEKLVGKIAIASAKLAYRIFGDLFSTSRFQAMAGHGARPQRLLWASTSTKNPKYSDVKYVEPLIGAQTINTVPLETLNAYRDHGKPRATLTEGVEEAKADLQELQNLGIDINLVTQQLEKEGVGKFDKAFDLLMKALSEKVSVALTRGAA